MLHWVSNVISKARIPPQTALALATKHELKWDKQHEIDMPNANVREGF